MKIKIITTPVIDRSGLMRSPQLDVGVLYATLKASGRADAVSMKDFRFFYYDEFYDKYKHHLLFEKEQFFDHKNIIALIKGELHMDHLFYKEAVSLYDSISEEFNGVDYLALPISVFEQFSLEYLLSALIFGYFFKSHHPNSKLIFFGNYRSSYIEDVMNNFSFIDGAVKKGDKGSVLEYINLAESSNLGKEVQNYIYRFEGRLIMGGEIRRDMDVCMAPDYSGFDLNVYRGKGKLVIIYEMGEGCKNSCFYCYNSTKGGVYFTKNIKKIFTELDILTVKYKTNLINFNDDEINYSNEFLLNLSEEIIKNKLNIFWTALIIPKDLEKELLKKLYEAGCRQLRFGIESGSQKMLDLIGKKTHLKEIEKILSYCKDIGISTYASFIVDLPQETNRDIVDTMEFIHKNRNNLDNIVICAYNTHLGTFNQRYFEYITGKGNYNFDRTKRFSSKKVLLRGFCDRLGMHDIDVIHFMKSNNFT